MARTYRNIPKNWNRRPKYKHKLLVGESPKTIVTDYDDKPIAARKENKHKVNNK